MKAAAREPPESRGVTGFNQSPEIQHGQHHQRPQPRCGERSSEVRYFGKKHGLTDDEVRDLIKQHGNDRKTLEEAVAKAKIS